jgi:hypothetical protein
MAASWQVAETLVAWFSWLEVVGKPPATYITVIFSLLIETHSSSAAASKLRELYPLSTPQEEGMLKVSDVHSLYYEVRGNPMGWPALVVHGGPGAGCYPNHAYVPPFTACPRQDCR